MKLKDLIAATAFWTVAASVLLATWLMVGAARA